MLKKCVQEMQACEKRLCKSYLCVMNSRVSIYAYAVFKFTRVILESASFATLCRYGKYFLWICVKNNYFEYFMRNVLIEKNYIFTYFRRLRTKMMFPVPR